MKENISVSTMSLSYLASSVSSQGSLFSPTHFHLASHGNYDGNIIIFHSTPFGIGMDQMIAPLLELNENIVSTSISC